ncbi:MCP four helix bundle domain-containing protein [Galbibacter mesophilus]|uniref:MCP four helix bundle domain-containing protein n=1 Tax=Galbibacter mesophilus TaxID=379069 RepID=UPI00191E4B76|nr:MCP four helix bundle domain-containing protein [Galbibacter mesophilus]MCM5664090.1 MCP four helix bundle domain-containing protein [Galbibacter mesophilus]
MGSKKKNKSNYKVNLAFILVTVILLILATNLIDKNHFTTAQDALKSVYEDRLIAQNYLYKINDIVYQKERKLLYDAGNSVKPGNESSLEGLLDKYGKTKLTTSERRKFESLQENLSKLAVLEKDFEKGKEVSEMQTKDVLQNIKTDLNGLSEIQLKEGKNRTQFAQKSLNTTNMLSNLELGFLIIIGVIAQFIIFFKVNKKTGKMGLHLA